MLLIKMPSWRKKRLEASWAMGRNKSVIRGTQIAAGTENLNTSMSWIVIHVTRSLVMWIDDCDHHSITANTDGWKREVTKTCPY